MTTVQTLVATATSGVASASPFPTASGTRQAGLRTKAKIGIALGIILAVFAIGLAVGWVYLAATKTEATCTRGGEAEGAGREQETERRKRQ